MRSIAGRLLAVVMAMAFAGIGGLGLLYLVTVPTNEDSEARLERALAVEHTIADVRGILAGQEATVLGYILTGDLAVLKPYTDGANPTNALIDELAATAAPLPRLDAKIPQLRSAILRWRTEWADPTINTFHRSQTDLQTGQAVAEGGRLHAAIDTQLDELDAMATDELAGAKAENIRVGDMRMGIFAGTGAAILLFTVLLALLLRNSVVRPLSRLAGTAIRVQEGADEPFVPEQSTELGQLSQALEGMRQGLFLARTWEEVRRMEETAQATEQRTVNDFTELLTYLLDEREIVVAASAAIEQALGPSGIVVHLLNASQDRAGVALVRGDATAEDLTRHTLDRCPGIRRGSPYLHEDVGQPLAVPCPAHSATGGTVACLPLTSGTERIGAIHLLWSEVTAMRPSSWSVVNRVCSQAGLTIANRRLVASLEASANTDPRTRLPNSRSFDVQAERVLASRGSESVGVLMLDLDHFKDLNDRFGHPAGDEALRVFAELLRRSLRPGDVPARYGGEEFAVLLPGADLQAAESVADRIRASLESTPILLGPGIVARITVSAGVAVAPSDGTERLPLLAAADRALYAAKHGGRNRVVAAASLITDESGEVTLPAAEPTASPVPGDRSERGAA